VIDRAYVIGDANGRGVPIPSAAVPEPATWAMMALGFAGLGFLGWRGSRRAVVLPV
jgi:hypothetical protein